MTIAGQLSVTASDDPRFKAGDSIGIVLDNSCTVTVTQNVEVSAPVAASTASAPVATNGTDADEGPNDEADATTDVSTPATA